MCDRRGSWLQSHHNPKSLNIEMKKPMNAMQRYISKELTHFVGGNLRKDITDEKQLLDGQYELLLKIIQEKCISHSPHLPRPLWNELKYCASREYSIGSRNKFSSNTKYVPQMVCFCDIPTGDLSIHISKFSPFGLSLKKSFLIERGANPVLYVEKNSAITYRRTFNFENNIEMKHSTRSEYFDELVDLYEKHCHGIIPLRRSKFNPPPQNECIDIGQFLFDILGYVKFFDASKSDDAEENYYMEREWRTPYDVHFGINDIGSSLF
jgi:hypothetical protein